MTRISLQTPLGPITIHEANGVLTRLDWRDDPDETSPLLNEAAAQLTAYFDRRLTAFDLPFDWGNGLQTQVRRAMAAIPLGQTRTYGDIARALSTPAQAIGQACGANPLPILIPCHRVLGAKGLGGFSAKGGVETKVWLLRHEGGCRPADIARHTTHFGPFGLYLGPNIPAGGTRPICSNAPRGVFRPRGMSQTLKTAFDLAEGWGNL